MKGTPRGDGGGAQTNTDHYTAHHGGASNKNRAPVLQIVLANFVCLHGIVAEIDEAARRLTIIRSWLPHSVTAS